MPFYELPVEWSNPDVGLKYTREEFDRRVAKPLEALCTQLEPFEQKVIGEIQVFYLDKLFNGAPN